jgi:hypothetical protein
MRITNSQWLGMYTVPLLCSLSTTNKLLKYYTWLLMHVALQLLALFTVGTMCASSGVLTFLISNSVYVRSINVRSMIHCMLYIIGGRGIRCCLGIPKLNDCQGSSPSNASANIYTYVCSICLSRSWWIIGLYMWSEPFHTLIHYMYGTLSWHTYSYAFSFLLKTGCDTCYVLGLGKEGAYAPPP